MRDMFKRSFDKFVKIVGFGMLKGIKAEKLLVGDEILEKCGEISEVLSSEVSSTGLSRRIEFKFRESGIIKKRTIRNESVFALLDQEELVSRNYNILSHINGLSGGTIATLTHMSAYQVIDKIRAEFYDWTEVSEKKYDTWQDAWRGFNSADDGGLYNFEIYDIVAEAKAEEEREAMEKQKEVLITEVNVTIVEKRVLKETLVPAGAGEKINTYLVVFLDGTSQELVNTIATIDELKKHFKRDIDYIINTDDEVIEVLESKIDTLPLPNSVPAPAGEIVKKIVDIPEELTFTIAEQELPKLDKLIKKAKKLDASFTVEVTPDRVEQVKLKYQTLDVQLHKVILKRQIESKIPNYSVLGRVTVTGLDENIVEPFWGRTFDIAPYKACKSTCEHCNTNRYRKLLYIVQDLSTGDMLTIGKSCLKDLCKINNIEYYVSYLELCFESFKELSSIDMDSPAGADRFLVDELSKESNLNFVKTIDCLGLIKKTIDKAGYISRTVASDRGVEATVDTMKYKFYASDMVSLGDTTTPEFKKLIEEDIVFYLENEVVQTEYDTMMYNLLSNKYILKEKAHFLSSFFIATKYLRERKRKEEQKSISQFVGTAGEKIDAEVTLSKVICYPSPFGYGNWNYIYKFTDRNENQIVWKTSKDLELEEGILINVRGTVKEHTVYAGEKQTVIIRAKIEEVR